jgi:enoyl-CoA hydratase
MIDLKIHDGVARIFLNRPEKSNALGSLLLSQVLAAFENLKGDASLRAAVLAGRGKAFCGGADVQELSRLDASNAGAFVEKIHRVCQAIRSLPVPVVARLHGAVIGAGLEIAAACDLRIAAEGTKFAMPEVRLGIPSVVEAALLPRLMGSGRAAWLVLTGEAIDAARAYEWGLLEEICPFSDLDERVDRLVRALKEGDREALRAQKALLQAWEEQPLSACVEASVTAFARSFAGENTISSRLKGKTD